MLKLRNNSGNQEVFDPIRKLWVTFTPEEQVRQFFILLLTEQLKINPVFISVEKQLTLNGLTKRYDILVYNREWQPWMVVECKAPHIELSQKVLEQAGRYNKILKAEIIAVTNGRENRFFHINFEKDEIREFSFPEIGRLTE